MQWKGQIEQRMHPEHVFRSLNCSGPWNRRVIEWLCHFFSASFPCLSLTICLSSTPAHKCINNTRSDLKNNLNCHLQPGKRHTPNNDNGRNGDSDSVRGGEALSMKQCYKVIAEVWKGRWGCAGEVQMGRWVQARQDVDGGWHWQHACLFRNYV